MLEVSATNLDMKTTTEVNYLPSMMDFKDDRALSSAGLLRHCSIYHAALTQSVPLPHTFQREAVKGYRKVCSYCSNLEENRFAKLTVNSFRKGLKARKDASTVTRK